MLSVIMLCRILFIVMLSAIMLCVIILSVITLSFIVLNVVMLSVIMLSAVMLNVVAPSSQVAKLFLIPENSVTFMMPLRILGVHKYSPTSFPKSHFTKLFWLKL